MQGSWGSRERSGRPLRVVFPLLLIVVGFTFLFNNLGIVPWSVWSTLAQLWPVLLILLGFDFVLGRRAGILGPAITAIVLVAVVAVAVGLSFRDAPASAEPAAQHGDFQIPLGSATSADLTLNFPVGALSVGALPASSDGALLHAQTSMQPSLAVSRRASVDGGVARVTLSEERDASASDVFPPGWPFASRDSRANLAWNLLLSPMTPLTLRADIGAGQADLDLTNLQVRQLTVTSGAGKTTIHFPGNAGQTVADVRSGAGQLVLIVPPDVGAQIHLERGVVNVHVPSDRFQAIDDGYQTTNYASAANRVDVTLRLGVGSVDVQ